ncbi:MAG TPA: aldose 1-epimerase [Baekduia sp.]
MSLFGRGREVLGRLGGLEAYAARGATFGIPFLHPWANRLGGFSYSAAGRDVALGADTPGLRVEEHGLPIHGLLAASRRWSVEEASEQTLRARLEWGGEEDAAFPAFPFPHELEMAVEQGETALRVSVTLTPTGDVGVPVSFGFHPYFQLPDVGTGDRLVLRTGAMSRLELDERGIPTGAREPFAPREIAIADEHLDTAFTDLGEQPSFTLTRGDHALTVRFLEGYTHLQLFTPPGGDVVAIEPMTAPTNALRSGDGLRLATSPFRATFEVDVSEVG